MRDYTTVGPSPYDESCAELGAPGYMGKAHAECRRFIDAIVSKLGPPPRGAQLAVKGFPHEYGTYYEVVCYFDDANETASEYAYACESQAPATWADTARVDWRSALLEQPPTLAEIASRPVAGAPQR